MFTHQNKSATSGYYDLSTPVTANTVVYPGDPQFCVEAISSLDNGAPVHLCHMHLSNHCGTHIDFPAHIIRGGKTSSDYALDDLIGTGLVIEVPVTEASISADFIRSQNSISRHDFVLFKTANSNLSKQDKFVENYVYIEEDAARELIKKEVKIVGIDYISVDSFSAESLSVHQALLSNNILIVESLELSKIPAGRYKIYIMPNNIPDMDGLPVRVIAESSPTR